ncbi:MAG: ribosome recycling factor [Thermodesulfobacteriota bacterium]|nr:MAG: ribosome recycling factor [Thermodesulfobacteriota bacterium]
MKEEIFSDLKKRTEKALEALTHELGGLRTGRASLAILDHVKVDYYGTPTPIKQIATLSVPESRTITIQPWDISQLHAIEKAIMTSDLGLTPSSDGKLIRINIPPLTEERRKDLVKLAKKYAEECKIAVRNVRRDANEGLKKLEKDKAISEDDLKKFQKEVQDVTDRQIHRIDEMVVQKEAEIMEV